MHQWTLSVLSVSGLVLIVSPGSTWADTDRGRYALRVTGKRSVSRPTGGLFPSCNGGGGIASPDFIIVHAAGQKLVNGDVWTFAKSDRDKTVIHDPHAANNMRREISFSHSGAEAVGFLTLAGLNADREIICADGVVLTGTYSR